MMHCMGGCSGGSGRGSCSGHGRVDTRARRLHVVVVMLVLVEVESGARRSVVELVRARAT